MAKAPKTVLKKPTDKALVEKLNKVQPTYKKETKTIVKDN